LEFPLKREEKKVEACSLIFGEKMQCWVRVRLRRRTDPN